MYECLFWPVTAGIYFMSEKWMASKNKACNPKVIYPKLFQRSEAYLESFVEQTADEFGCKCLKITRADWVNDCDLNYVKAVVADLIFQYNGLIYDKMKKESGETRKRNQERNKQLDTRVDISEDNISEKNIPSSEVRSPHHSSCDDDLTEEISNNQQDLVEQSKKKSSTESTELLCQSETNPKFLTKQGQSTSNLSTKEPKMIFLNGDGGTKSLGRLGDPRERSGRLDVSENNGHVSNTKKTNNMTRVGVVTIKSIPFRIDKFQKDVNNTCLFSNGKDSNENDADLSHSSSEELIETFCRTRSKDSTASGSSSDIGYTGDPDKAIIGRTIETNQTIEQEIQLSHCPFEAEVPNLDEEDAPIKISHVTQNHQHLPSEESDILDVALQFQNEQESEGFSPNNNDNVPTQKTSVSHSQEHRTLFLDSPSSPTSTVVNETSSERSVCHFESPIIEKNQDEHFEKDFDEFPFSW